MNQWSPRYADGITPAPARRDVEETDSAVTVDETDQPLTTAKASA
jgi:hypothetical protein